MRLFPLIVASGVICLLATIPGWVSVVLCILVGAGYLCYNFYTDFQERQRFQALERRFEEQDTAEECYRPRW